MSLFVKHVASKHSQFVTIPCFSPTMLHTVVLYSPFKCEAKSHGNVQVLNLFARPFSVHVVQSVLQWGKEPIVLIKREEISKKSNANNEPVVPKKRKSHKNAKADEQLAKKLKEDNEGVA